MLLVRRILKIHDVKLFIKKCSFIKSVVVGWCFLSGHFLRFIMPQNYVQELLLIIFVGNGRLENGREFFSILKSTIYLFL